MFQVHPTLKTYFEPGSIATSTTFFKITVRNVENRGDDVESSKNSLLQTFLKKTNQDKSNQESTTTTTSSSFQNLFGNTNNKKNLPTSSWVIFRRYSEIMTFRDYLCAKFPTLIIPMLQPKPNSKSSILSSSFLTNSSSSSGNQQQQQNAHHDDAEHQQQAAEASSSSAVAINRNDNNNLNYYSSVLTSTMDKIISQASTSLQFASTTGNNNNNDAHHQNHDFQQVENIISFFSHMEEIIDRILILEDPLVCEFLIAPRIYFKGGVNNGNTVSSTDHHLVVETTSFETIGHKLLTKFGNENDSDDDSSSSSSSEDDDENEKKKKMTKKKTKNSSPPSTSIELPAIPVTSSNNSSSLKFQFGCCQTCVEQMKKNEIQLLLRSTSTNPSSTRTAGESATPSFFSFEKFASTVESLRKSVYETASQQISNFTTSSSTTEGENGKNSSLVDKSGRVNISVLLSSSSSASLVLPPSVIYLEKSKIPVKINYGNLLSQVVVDENSSTSNTENKKKKKKMTNFELIREFLLQNNESSNRNNDKTATTIKSVSSPYLLIFTNLLNIVISTQLSAASIKIHLEKQSLLLPQSFVLSSEHSSSTTSSYNQITSNIISNLQNISSILSSSSSNQQNENNQNEAIHVLRRSMKIHQTKNQQQQSSSSTLSLFRKLTSFTNRSIAVLEMFIRVLKRISGMMMKKKNQNEKDRRTSKEEEVESEIFFILQDAHDEIDKEKKKIVEELNQVWEFNLEKLRIREKKMMI